MVEINIALLVLLILLQCMDALTTDMILEQGGYEANPVIKWLMDHTSTRGALVIKSLVVAFMGMFIYLYEPLLLIPLDALYVWVVYHNYGQIK